VYGPVRFIGASPLGAPTTSGQEHGIYPNLTGQSSSSPTTSSIAATAAPSLPLRKSIEPRALVIRRQSFHLRTTVRTRFLNARRRRSSHQDLGSHPEQLLVVGHHFTIDFSPPTSHVFAHAAHGPRYHRRSHQGDLFFQLTILGFTSG
jgi:hypothetical protein